jgi:hypothetical protein
VNGNLSAVGLKGDNTVFHFVNRCESGRRALVGRLRPTS